MRSKPDNADIGLIIDSTQIRDDRRRETVTLLVIDLNTISSLPHHGGSGILIPVLCESNHASTEIDANAKCDQGTEVLRY